MKNKEKRGTLYSISKGILNANGKYLIIMDKNCFFLDDDALINIYKEIEKEGVDIIEFNLYKILSDNYMNLYKCNHYESGLNLSKIKYNLSFEEIDIKKELLTNK